MRLALRHGPAERAKLDEIRAERGMEPVDVIKALLYRPDFFGARMNEAFEEVMRGPSEWTAGERELFAAFVSRENSCPFGTQSHGAVASYALGTEIVEAVRADLDTAPVDSRLRETLRFLRKLTLEPDALGPADARRVLASGVSAKALEDAIDVCALFNIIDRIADALRFDLPEPAYWERVAPGFLAAGYAQPASPMR